MDRQNLPHQARGFSGRSSVSGASSVISSVSGSSSTYQDDEPRRGNRPCVKPGWHRERPMQRQRDRGNHGAGHP